MKRSRSRSTLLATVLAAEGLAPAAARAQAEYQFTLVEAFTPNYSLRECYLWDISDAGMACGMSTYEFQNGGSTSISYAGFTWTAETEKTVLPFSDARAVNNAGMVASTGVIFDRAANQVAYTLPTPAGGFGGFNPTSINDALNVGGWVLSCNCSNSQGLNQFATLWDPVAGSRTVGVPGAKEITHINEHNVATGNIRASGGVRAGFVYDIASGAATNLSTLLPPGQFGQVPTTAQGINDAGVVTGDYVDQATFLRQGYTWSPAQGFTFFGVPGMPTLQVYPRSINGAGTVVGYAMYDPANSVGFHAFVWDREHGLRDLNTLAAGVPAGFIIDRALRINEQGWIVGDGHYGPNWGTSRAFVLRPVTPPTPCYANCDASTVDPVLNVLDFNCFLNRFAAGESYANCDGSAVAPVLNVLDFNCFLNRFAAGCP